MIENLLIYDIRRKDCFKWVRKFDWFYVEWTAVKCPKLSLSTDTPTYTVRRTQYWAGAPIDIHTCVNYSKKRSILERILRVVYRNVSSWPRASVGSPNGHCFSHMCPPGRRCRLAGYFIPRLCPHRCGLFVWKNLDILTHNINLRVKYNNIVYTKIILYYPTSYF